MFRIWRAFFLYELNQCGYSYIFFEQNLCHKCRIQISILRKSFITIHTFEFFINWRRKWTSVCFCITYSLIVPHSSLFKCMKFLGLVKIVIACQLALQSRCFHNDFYTLMCQLSGMSNYLIDISLPFETNYVVSL